MSYGGNADPTGIQVTFLDQTGAKSVKAVIAFSVPVSRILPNIITKMNLPTTSPDGQPMSYSLDHKEGGRRLLESQTLLEAGVQNGDHLIVYPEVVAGASLAPDTIAGCEVRGAAKVSGKPEGPCSTCDGRSYSWGRVGAQGLNFLPEPSTFLRRFFQIGFTLPARRCNDCGNLQLFDAPPTDRN